MPKAGYDPEGQEPYAIYDTILVPRNLCCFCCCDYRRAVMVIDALVLVFVVLIFYLSSNGSPEISRLDAGIAGIAFLTAGIYGAKTYRPWGVVLAAIPHSISTLYFSYCTLVVPGAWKFPSATFAIPSAYCLYAHHKLLQLMKQGIITPENYPNVSSCCCCG